MITAKYTKYTKAGRRFSILWPTEHTDYTEKISGPEPLMDAVKQGKARPPGGLGLKEPRVPARPEVRPYLRSQPRQEPVGLGLR